MTFAGQICLLFEHSIGVSLFETEEEKFSSRKRVFADLAFVCWGLLRNQHITHAREELFITKVCQTRHANSYLQ